MKDTAEALSWIVEILNANQIPFQISGGLAARAYGSPRALNDIDISITEAMFPLVERAVSPHITFGPSLYNDGLWELMLMTLNYRGQDIDLGGGHEQRIRDHASGQWIHFVEDFSSAQPMSIFGVTVPVICRQDLVAYKQLLGRDEDREDLAAIE